MGGVWCCFSRTKTTEKDVNLFQLDQARLEELDREEQINSGQNTSMKSQENEFL